MNNRILLPRPTIIGREHAFECFCSETCRTASAERVARDYSGGEIEEEYFRVIHRQQEELLNRLLKKTKRKILFGYSFGKTSLEGTRYVSFGAWVSAQPQYRLMTRPERRDMSTKIRHATKVFEDWDRIVHNLINPNYKFIDARRFSIEQFYRARCDTWVFKQNKLLGPKEQVPRAIANYDNNKVQLILDFIKNTMIIDDVSGDDEQLKLISTDILIGMKMIRDNDI